jgi:hypothetical protein
MSWGKRKDLLSNPDNIETADWKQIPNNGRSLHWGPQPTKFPPQMCYNAPAIMAAAKDRAKLIGAEIERELAVLKAAGKEHLFAGVIAGSETQIGREFATERPLGFRALVHRGFSEKNPPRDLDAERVSVVKEWIELWAKSLHAAGTPRDKIYCHIVFSSQGLDKPDAKKSYAEKVHFALPEVAFSSAYRPGFSTYPEGRTFNEIYTVLARHAVPGWISAEGTNVSPTSLPGEPTMETYLGRVFNHGGVLVNVFSWGIGGEAHRNNFFRQATENAEALAAYAKFLRGEKLVESRQGFSGPAFVERMHKIQTDLPGWIQKTGRQAEAMPKLQKAIALTKDKKWQEADKLASELLELMSADQPKEGKTEAPPLQERLPTKIQRIQKKLPAWIGSDAAKKSKATALMQKLEGHLKAKDFEEAEKTADSILGMLGSPQARDKEPAVKEPALQKELLDIEMADQEARAAFFKSLGEKGIALGEVQSIRDPDQLRFFLEQLGKMEAVDKKNRDRLKEIVAKHGWPGRSLVGRDGAHAVWLVVQHSVADLAFMRRCLASMKAAPKGEVEPKHVAYLTDRILVKEGKKQIYGTELNGKFVPEPIEDEANVDKRRADVGLMPLAEYLKFTREHYEKAAGKKSEKK